MRCSQLHQAGKSALSRATPFSWRVSALFRSSQFARSRFWIFAPGGYFSLSLILQILLPFVARLSRFAVLCPHPAAFKPCTFRGGLPGQTMKAPGSLLSIPILRLFMYFMNMPGTLHLGGLAVPGKKPKVQIFRAKLTRLPNPCSGRAASWSRSSSNRLRKLFRNRL